MNQPSLPKKRKSADQHPGHEQNLVSIREAYLNGQEEPHSVRPLVREAWARCRNYGLDPHQLRQQPFDQTRLEQARALNRQLLEVSAPILQYVHETVKDQPHLVALSDSNGLILRLLTDPLADQAAGHSANLFEGASWNERDIGCNGVGTALATQTPVILIGAEHYANDYVGWTCIGIPLRAPEGHIVGVLDLSVPNQDVNTHTWGWMRSVGHTIEAELARPHWNLRHEDLDQTLGELNDPFNVVTGVFDLLARQFNLTPEHQSFLDEARTKINEAQIQLRTTIAELLQTQAKLRAANRNKDRFTSVLSHELLNPISAASLGIDLVKNTDNPNERDEFLDITKTELDTCRRLIEELCDAAHIAAGKLKIDKQLLPVSHVIDRACQSVRPAFEKQQHQLVLSRIDENVCIEADPERLQQVLVNLLKNAAKYTDPGGRIELATRIQEETVHITVRDNGIGLSSEDLTTIFDMFSQSEQALQRADGGIGIGLALVRQIVYAHGGTIRAHSDGPGHGSRFTVQLPLAPQSQPCHSE